MGNLVRMDLYRMNKAKSFRVCLILAFVFALTATPFEYLMVQVGKMFSTSGTITFPTEINLSTLINRCATPLTVLLALLSIVNFYYADMEAGYIKNIAGQMPKKGFTMVSRFIASVPHNAVFLLVSVIGSIIGTVIFQKIIFDGAILESIVTFLLKILLLTSVCSILLLVTAAFRNKSFGMILAVLIGLTLTSLLYTLVVNPGLNKIFTKVDITPYMPDAVLAEEKPGVLRAILVSAVTIGIFLPLSARVFDRKDVK